MSSARSYNVGLTESAIKDLEDAGREARKLIKAILRLDDEDIHSWERLDVPRGGEGSWVVFNLRDSWVMAQWDQGKPKLWFLGRGLRDAGSGFLKVVRIVPATELADLIRAIEETGDS